MRFPAVHTVRRRTLRRLTASSNRMARPYQRIARWPQHRTDSLGAARSQNSRDVLARERLTALAQAVKNRKPGPMSGCIDVLNGRHGEGKGWFRWGSGR